MDKALLVREMVRGYNGGREFTREHNQWVIHTTVPVKFHGYPNRILGTKNNIHYDAHGIGTDPTTHSQLTIDSDAIRTLVGALEGSL